MPASSIPFQFLSATQWATVFTAWVATAMLLIAISDWRRFLVPDVLSLPSIPVGIAANILVLHTDASAGLVESLSGIAIGGGAFYLLRSAYFATRGIEGLGLGDVKLAAVAGAWLGPTLLAPACLLASITALGGILILHPRQADRSAYKTLHIPFGCFIAPAILLFWLYRLWEAGLVAS